MGQRTKEFIGKRGDKLHYLIGEIKLDGIEYAEEIENDVTDVDSL